MTPLLLGLLGFGLIRAANAEVHRFERLAALDIASKLGGDTKRVQVQAKVGPEAVFGDVHQVTIRASNFTANGLPLYTEPQRSKRGLVRDLRIEMGDFSLRGLHVQSLRAQIPDCRFDLSLAAREHQMRLSRSGLGSGEVVVTAADLKSFILAKFHEVKRVEVTFDHDKIFVEGHGEFLLLSTDFLVVAHLTPIGGSRLTLTDAKVSLDGEPATPEVEKVLLGTLNPVVDLDRDLGLHGAMNVDHISLGDGLLRAGGPTKIPELPRE